VGVTERAGIKVESGEISKKVCRRVHNLAVNPSYRNLGTGDWEGRARGDPKQLGRKRPLGGTPKPRGPNGGKPTMDFSKVKIRIGKSCLHSEDCEGRAPNKGRQPALRAGREGEDRRQIQTAYGSRMRQKENEGLRRKSGI